MLHKQS